MRFFRLFYPFFNCYILNYWVSYSPFFFFRKYYFKAVGITLGDRCLLDMAIYFLKPANLFIGDRSHINRGCFLDARGGIVIGNNVSISHNVSIVSASHDLNAKDFAYVDGKVTIEDNAWIGLNAVILKGVTIGKGAVVAAGSVVVKDVKPYSVVGGIPAREITQRSDDLDYDVSAFAFYNGKFRKPYFL